MYFWHFDFPFLIGTGILSSSRTLGIPENFGIQECLIYILRSYMPDLWEIRPQVADIILILRIFTSVLGWASLTRGRQVPLIWISSEFLRSNSHVWCYALSGATSFLKCDRSHWGISSDWPLLPRLPCAWLLYMLSLFKQTNVEHLMNGPTYWRRPLLYTALSAALPSR